jgi:hypothetical protein
VGVSNEAVVGEVSRHHEWIQELQLQVAKLQAEVFNLKNPVGTKVRFWQIRRENGDFDGNHVDTVTRSPAEARRYTAVVFLEGVRGYVCLDHVVVI